jgi:hypothetical protein
MVPVMSLWLPIVLSAAIVFVTSSIIHMLLPFHRDDWRRLPNEDAAIDALRRLDIAPGDYLLPRPSSRDAMKSPEFQAKLKAGPLAVMTVRAGGSASMGRSLALWFAYAVVVGVFAAYISGRALAPGTRVGEVLRFAGCTAFLGYSLALFQNSIWYWRNWGATLRSVVDGLVYGLLTGAVFGWLWPR